VVAVTAGTKVIQINEVNSIDILKERKRNMCSKELVTLDRPEKRISRVTLNRPEKRNALSPELREALLARLLEAVADETTRAVIVTANGGHFSAGGDLASLAGIDAVAGRRRIKRGHEIVQLILTSDKPIISAVEGYAMGAGAGLAIACDTVVVDKGTTVGFPFLKVGLGPDYGVSYTLMRRMTPGSARHAFLHAKNFSGEEAVACGLADELAEAGNVQNRALELAANLASLPPHALALAKRQFVLAPADFDGAAEMEAMTQAICFEGKEFLEGVAAFTQKRRPKF